VITDSIPARPIKLPLFPLASIGMRDYGVRILKMAGFGSFSLTVPQPQKMHNNVQ